MCDINYKFEKIVKRLKDKGVKVEKYYFDKRYNIFLIFWNGFVVGKWDRNRVDKTHPDVLLLEVLRLIQRIKILYNSPKEKKIVRSLEVLKG